MCARLLRFANNPHYGNLTEIDKGRRGRKANRFGERRKDRTKDCRVGWISWTDGAIMSRRILKSSVDKRVIIPVDKSKPLSNEKLFEEAPSL